jgi:hypothetical protein
LLIPDGILHLVAAMRLHSRSTAVTLRVIGWCIKSPGSGVSSGAR